MTCSEEWSARWSCPGSRSRWPTGPVGCSSDGRCSCSSTGAYVNTIANNHGLPCNMCMCAVYTYIPVNHTDRQTDRQTHGQAGRDSGQTNRQACRQTDRQTDTRTGRQAHRQTDTRTGRQAHRQAGRQHRQTDTRTGRQAHRTDLPGLSMKGWSLALTSS